LKIQKKERLAIPFETARLLKIKAAELSTEGSKVSMSALADKILLDYFKRVKK